MRKTIPVRDRFESKVLRIPGGCWEWTAARDQITGYAMLGIKVPDGRWVPTTGHRVAYELFVGPIPDGFVIDHLCRNRGCVNPDHLEPVRQRVNFLRGMHPSAVGVRTGKCKRGHDLSGDNVIQRPGHGRECLACVKHRNALRFTKDRGVI